MNNSCYTCDKHTRVWAKVSNYSTKESKIYCSYDCYKKNPMIVPQHHIYKCLQEDPISPIIIPHMNKTNDRFIHLTETEINDLSDEQYRNYKINLEENLQDNCELYYNELSNEKRETELEELFYESASDDEIDDY